MTVDRFDFRSAAGTATNIGGRWSIILAGTSCTAKHSTSAKMDVNANGGQVAGIGVEATWLGLQAGPLRMDAIVGVTSDTSGASFTTFEMWARGNGTYVDGNAPPNAILGSWYQGQRLGRIYARRASSTYTQVGSDITSTPGASGDIVRTSLLVNGAAVSFRIFNHKTGAHVGTTFGSLVTADMAVLGRGLCGFGARSSNTQLFDLYQFEIRTGRDALKGLS